jgi:hypothetical protein
MVAELDEGSSRFREMYDINGNVLSGGNAISRFVITEMGPQLSNDTGLFIYTPKNTVATNYYYAVTEVINNVEDRNVNANNSTGPISEIKRPIDAVKYYEASGRSWYIMWMDYDLFKDNYMGYAFVIGITNNAFVNSGSTPAMHLDGIGTMNIYSADYSNYGQGDISSQGLPTWYFGYHESKNYNGTYDSGRNRQGNIANYMQYRVIQASLWARREFNFVDEQFHINGNSMGASGAYGFAIAFPYFVTSVFCNQGLTDYANTGTTPNGDIMWADSIRGNYGEPALHNPVKLLPFNDSNYPNLDWYTKFNGRDVYLFRDVVDFMTDNPEISFPLISSGHSTNDGSIQYESQGAHFEEFIKDSRQCFSYHVNDAYHGWGSIEGSMMLGRMRRNESRPGFSNVPSRNVYRYNDYNYFEQGGRGYMLGVVWGTSESPINNRSITETNTSWSIPIQLVRPINSPLNWDDPYVVDITPHNLQRMQVQAGDVFNYEVTNMQGVIEESGQIIADNNNLLMIPNVPIRVSGAIARVTFVSAGDPDNEAPSIPQNLTASVVSTSQVNLSWSVSTDNVAVTGYRIYRDGTQIAITNTNSYSNTGLSSNTTYRYRVAAYDAAGNTSGQSNEVSATTQSTPPPQGNGRPLPDTRGATYIWADQIRIDNDAQINFIAENFIGSQKLTKNISDAIRVLNPDFLVLQYHKAYGVDLGDNITGPNEWSPDIDKMMEFISANPGYGAEEGYYLHWTNINDLAHRVQHYWAGNLEYYLADVRSAGFRAYVAAETVRRCEDIGFDGSFFDVALEPYYAYEPDYDGGGNMWYTYTPWNWSTLQLVAQNWNNMIIPYWQYIENEYHSNGNNYLCIVNGDRMITGWYDPAFLDYVDGSMAENWMTDGGGVLTGGDWVLSASRVLRYITGNDKILIAQPNDPSSGNIGMREWWIANYLLLKNNKTFYNYAWGDLDLSWWPEYEINLGE